MSVHEPPASNGPAYRCTIARAANSAVIRLTLHGDMDVHALAACTAQALADARRDGCNTLLMDARAMRALLTPADIYWLPARFEELGFEPRHRLAVLYSSRTAEPMDVLLAENVFINRGHCVRAFADEDRALAWLAARDAH